MKAYGAFIVRERFSTLLVHANEAYVEHEEMPYQDDYMITIMSPFKDIIPCKSLKH